MSWQREASVVRRPESQSSRKQVSSGLGSTSLCCLFPKAKGPVKRHAPRLIKEHASSVGAPPCLSYLPHHVGMAFTSTQLTAMRKFAEDDVVRLEDVGNLLLAGGSLAGAARTKACASIFGREQEASFISVAAWIAKQRPKDKTKQKLVIPLPPCCLNEACSAEDAPMTVEKGMTAEQRALYTVFCGETQGLITKDAVRSILASAYGLSLEGEAFDAFFAGFDLDDSKTLDFEEFCAMIQSFDSGSFGGHTQPLTEEQRGSYSELEIALLHFHFKEHDGNQDGVIDARELRAVLKAHGYDMTERTLRTSVMRNLDEDRSGSLEFGEFCVLMRNLAQGDYACLEDGYNAFSEARMAEHGVSPGSRFLALELAQLLAKRGHDYPLYLADLRTTDEGDPAIYATIAGPTLDDTPYAKRRIEVCVRASKIYPLTPPVAFFCDRLVHLNFEVCPDGTTLFPQLLRHWTAESWSLEALLERLHDLLRSPELSLFAHVDQLPIIDGAVVALSTPAGLDLRQQRRATDFAQNLMSMHQTNRPLYDAIVKAEAAKMLPAWDHIV